MTATLDRGAAGGPAPLPGPAPGPGSRRVRVGRANGLTLGIVTLWLSLIVLLPLAALTAASVEEGWAGFWDAVTAPTALAALGTTILISAGVALLNVVAGTLIAWVLVRDRFPGKRVVDALIDLPFALPTIVASIVLLSLYGPSSPIGVELNATRWGVGIALAFVTLPFVVRSVQPVLIELDADVEQAAASLGAGNWATFRRVVLPALTPAIVSGGGLAFARAIGEYGSVVLIGGNIPRETQVASQYIQQQIETDRPVAAAAVSVALLLVSFSTLPRASAALRRRRPAVRRLADRRRRRPDHAVGSGRLVRRARGPRRQGHLRPAGDGDRDAVRHPAVRGPGGGAGAARDRHRAGTGGGHPRRVRVADLHQDHPARHPLGPHLRDRPHRRPRARRVRRGDHGQLLREPASGDAFFAQLTRAEAADLDLRAGDRVWVLPTRTLSSEVRPTALAS